MTESAVSIEEYTGKDYLVEDYLALREEIYSSGAAHRKFEDCVGELDDSSQIERLKRGIGMYLLHRHTEAVELLKPLRSDPVPGLFYARSLLELGRAEEALGQLKEIGQTSKSNPHILLSKVRAAVATGQRTEAHKLLENLAEKFPGVADVHHEMGVFLDADGEYEEAQAAYERAIETDPTYSPSLFRIALFAERSGDHGRALELYESIVEQNPWHVGTMLNLGNLYEDEGRYDDAIQCYERILEFRPDHERARLYKKDAVGGLTMFFDEDQERRTDKRNQILNIPITDFELSVRSKNCLAKMNVRTLGDLCQKTEQELLNYKNFGETSLVEIREILEKKSLRLGMFREEEADAGMQEHDAGMEQIRATSISELELSIRSRKALNSLGISTIGDLLKHSEMDFMNCKNFGMTSMNELKSKLGERGLKLKDQL